MPERRKIALLIETSLASGRQIIMGIGDYMRENDHWSVFQQTEILGTLNPQALENWEGDGIIARIANQEFANIVATKNIPIIDVLGNLDQTPFPKVICDEQKLSQLAFQHFQSKGYQNYAYFGLNDEAWSIRRGDSFRNLVDHEKKNFSRFTTSRSSRNTQGWTHYITEIAAWLKILPKPIGLLVCSDQLGIDLLEACSQANVSVPSEVALLGVDNDKTFCEICRPKLSSISANHRQIGYQAAALLDQLLDNNAPIPNETHIKPHSITTRQSTDSIAVEDPHVVKALQLIRDEACTGIGVDELASRVGASRSVLQRRFRLHLNKSINLILVSNSIILFC